MKNNVVNKDYDIKVIYNIKVNIKVFIQAMIDHNYNDKHSSLILVICLI